MRPYLVAHEQRPRGYREPENPTLQRHRHGPLPPNALSRVSQVEEPDEWGELAGLVRQWHAQQQPVA
ncbi:hypothetical protein BQ8420_22230 [Nocardiopsis sp. JB363]|nr:hypothetical protein BQ8420_22230 [Nocardiopsis sp. JB363]